MDTAKISGFDMAPTIKWYEVNALEIYRRLVVPDGVTNVSFEFHQTIRESILHKADFSGLIRFFPAQARARSILAMVSLLPSAWFHRDSTPQIPKETSDPSEALSPTAIIPSKVDYDKANQPPGFTAHVKLFEISDSAARRLVREIIHLQGFVHEFAHTIITPEFYHDFRLCLPTGEIVKGGEHLLGFQELVNSHPPLSHYVTAYMDENGKLNNNLRALNEALAETVAAHLLGFAASPDGTGLHPFDTRAPLRDFVEAFLLAERVP